MLLDRSRSWLDAARGPTGAWGYVPGGAPALEPTLLAVAAGGVLAGDWLASQPTGWGTLMLPACLRDRGEPEADALRLAALPSIRGWEPWLAPETPGDFDGGLRGWSWVPGTFTWVEPTLWALLSLRALDEGGDPRVAEGLEVLADRQGADGGWNAGNPSVLGAALPSYAYLTGLVLLALPPGHPSVAPALAFLRSEALRPSALGFASVILGLARHREPVGALAGALSALAADDGGFNGRVDRTALAVLALGVARDGVGPLLPRREGAHGG